MNEATSGQMRGYSLHALMDTVIHAAGHHFYGSRKSDDFIRAALQPPSGKLLQASSIEADGFSTMSLSNILSNVANKGLIAAYSAVEVCWPNVCGVRNHSDFKVHTRYRLDSTGAFKKVAADGELKHVGLTDASYTNQLGDVRRDHRPDPADAVQRRPRRLHGDPEPARPHGGPAARGGRLRAAALQPVELLPRQQQEPT
jgi:hypothetical protein